MLIINQEKEVLARIITNHGLSLDDALELANPETAKDGETGEKVYIFNGEEYFYDDLSLVDTVSEYKIYARLGGWSEDEAHDEKDFITTIRITSEEDADDFDQAVIDAAGEIAYDETTPTLLMEGGSTSPESYYWTDGNKTYIYAYEISRTPKGL